MQANAGVASARALSATSRSRLNSGPAAAPTAALFFGTSARPRERRSASTWEGRASTCASSRTDFPTRSQNVDVCRYRIGIPMINVNAIGAGGGSIAWVDAGGILRVGPRSAEAVPGPACYRRGGTEPTVTDANVVLGYLSPAALLGRSTCDRPGGSPSSDPERSPIRSGSRSTRRATASSRSSITT